MENEILERINVPAVIDRDECIYCFETPVNNIPEGLTTAGTEHSLNICLSCFQSVCELHRELHMNVTQNSCDTIHVNYLNVAKLEKSKKETDNAGDVTPTKKIKLQVTEKSEDDLYDTVWELIQVQGENTEVLLNSESLRGQSTPEKISSILSAKSQQLADQASSWQLEIHTCEHSRNFNVADVPVSKIDTSKCNDCGLDSNLWLCLHCGNLGCGREQIGIEGHSHGLKHYETHNDHCLAIKLGSLSENSNDLYCYQCDDEVKFNDGNKILSLILQKFGIDISNKMATEKTLTELQVEQNMNWDFKMTDSQGNQLISLQANDELGCGLLNLGNSCYLNSAIQCLLNGGVSHWGEQLIEDIGVEFPMDVVYPSNNLKCQLIKLTNALKMTPDQYPQGIKPRSFKKCIGGNHEEFSSNRQQDAMEFLTYLIAQLDKKYFDKKSNTNDDEDYNNNPSDLMRFTMEDKLQCQTCHKVKYSYSTAEALQLPLLENDETQDIKERLSSFFANETIEFNCPNCKSGVSNAATKQAHMKTFPDTLVLNPVRIKLANWTPVKTSNELLLPGVDDPEDLLDMSQWKAHGFDVDNEQLMEDNEAQGFEPNAESMSQLKEMGFTENAAMRALYATGNQPGSTESAMNWLFQHVDDADLNDPFEPPSSDKQNSNNREVDSGSLDTMLAMGLDGKLSTKALLLNQGDVSRSIEWVFNNMDDDGEIIETNTAAAADSTTNTKEYGHDEPLRYKLRGVVCHKGNSVHSGHYVAFIRKTVPDMTGEQWVLYNDEKIVLAQDTQEIRQNGYIYFYSRS
ncbi:similar to Saccharomyces cerevisiae YBR058C UBP14 Ubiquitin-specific protease that specifically disassembles unanchored ubiquitin chains [Maudiozyma barnettii]|uniref:Ubiquitin carboxyl-terminal hydrolase n=1 Tax=Maudiozyma barnettii TaxID=61262 RepID=A0A8H2VHQ9_9SACH|nr:ubiquitin-specific protease UBP14 [Kazachstania barnettii]CAB4255896.1 similar to Saccharomyces cerevisiae YBR058C UBP14 Ubiquitin-specific protease that specifically disassembles unanchored ubiquitin chains [Kazachstania barnettii]CAD1784456.1 similar to Saccharomyces cerevisiae YBR058C UBP14 Ubiquitin-specific protease that specifically disassembles unanchored ubiquitin chains [Kazachstania barnettii]